MRCAVCSEENPSGSKFCSRCGNPLKLTCPGCGRDNDSAANFCNGCGLALQSRAGVLAAQTPDTGERRLVTALFADLVGFTPFAESRDPEDVRSLLVRYFAAARDVVERFGGVVDKYTGDAVTAFWGAHATHEDDAARAVRAGLALVSTVADLGDINGIPDLRVRVGVLTGETSVGPGGNATGLVVGDVVNTAARLQTLAEPGTVLVGEPTRALAAGTVSFEPRGAHRLKGLSRPVDTFRATGVLDRPGATTSGPEPPFVGRSLEMRLVRDQLEATIGEGRCRLVSIIGDGGIGKSRLARELIDGASRSARPIEWHAGISSDHGHGVALSALGQMIREQAGIGAGDDEATSLAKLEAAVADVSADADEARWIRSRLAGLLDLEPLPPGDRDDLFGSLRTYFQRVADRGGLLLVFEDLQWADDILLDFIADLVERSHRHPILVLTLARPELLDRRGDWGAVRQGFASTHLGPLSDSEMTELVNGMVPGIPKVTVDLVVGAAAGIPLYAVEYVLMLLGSGILVPSGTGFQQTADVESLTLPDSLHAVVGARLDRLDAAERAVVQDAAVLGDSFTVTQLAITTDRPAEELRPVLERLVRSRVFDLDDDPRSPTRGACRFVQSTIREVAYRRLSRAERQRRHLRVVELLREADVAEFAGVVASHYLSALEAKPDPELAARARTVLLDAARRAAALHAYDQAVHLVDHALLIPAADAERVPLWEVGADAASGGGDTEKGLALANQALTWHLDKGSAEGVTAARIRIGRILSEADQSMQAVDALAPYFDPDRANEPEIARLGLALAWGLAASGEEGRAATVARDILVTASQIGDAELVVALLRVRGYALNYLDRVHESVALLREAIRLAGELDSPAAEAAAISNLILVDGRNGRNRDPGPPMRLRELAARAGSPAIERAALAWTSRIQTALGEYAAARQGYASYAGRTSGFVATYDESRLRFLDWVLDGDRRHLEDSTELLVSTRATVDEEPQLQDFLLSALSQNAFALGDPERAFGLAERADITHAVPHSFLFDIPIYSAFRMGDIDLLEQARARVPVTAGDRSHSLHAVATAGMSVLAERSDEAVDRFLEVAERHASVDGPGDTAQLRTLLAEAIPGNEAARDAARRAHSWFTEHGAKGYLGLYSGVWDMLAVP